LAQTALRSALALSREDLEWLRDQIDEHLAEPTEEDEAPFEFAPEEPAEETAAAATPRLRRRSPVPA
jgi:hypothetical protein